MGAHGLSNFSKIEIDPYGVIKDTNPLDVGEEWTNVQNMRFNDDAAQKIGGESLATDLIDEPYHLQFNGNHSDPLWVVMSDDSVFATDFLTDTPLGATTPGTNWDSTLFNNIPVMNNTIDAPYYWDGVLTNNIATLPAFPANTLCEAVRPYRSFLIALNITESAVKQENRIIWSDSSDAGALPASWAIGDPTTLAGDAYLTSSKGEVIDGLQLRDLFVIYKTHAIYIMRLIGGQSVMKIDKIQVNSGILAKNCVSEYKGIHFVVSDADVVLFDGQSVKSIADKRVRSEIFGNIDTVNYVNSYVARYDRQDEMWFCYPTQGQTYANKAAIWNWHDDQWTFRDLSNSRHIASGLANFAISPTYDEALYTYNSVEAQVPYNPVSNNPTTDTLITATDLKLGIIDETFNTFDIPMPSMLEKVTMTLGDEDSIKMVKSVTPRITANAETVVYIRIGTQMEPDDNIFWGPEQSYTVGTDREAFFTQKGRYISVRFRTQAADDNWKCHGFYLKVAQSGKY